MLTPLPPGPRRRSAARLCFESFGKENHMKTPTLLMTITAIALAAATPSVAATQNAGSNHKNLQSSEKQTGFWDSNGNFFHDAVTYPVRAVSRIGKSAENTPTIARETMNGDRSLVSSHGMLT